MNKTRYNLKGIYSFFLIIQCFFVFIFFLIPISERDRKGNSSLKIYSAEKILFKENREKHSGSFKNWINMNEFPPFLIEGILVAEDKRFFLHPGIDPISIIRAAFSNMNHRRIVSGASTITQQLTRLIYKEKLPKNHYLRKLLEIIYAIKLELYFSKKEILEAYLNRVPLNYNRIGLGSAAIRIFNRDLRFLSRSELITLIILIRQHKYSKSLFLYRFKKLSKKLNYKIENRTISKILNQLKVTYYNSQISNKSFLQHFHSWIIQKYPDLSGDFDSTISYELNSKNIEILKSELRHLKEKNVNNGAIIVLEFKGNDKYPSLVSMIGSQNYNSKDSGQVNGSIAIRSAGSTLKPFLYAMAFDKNMIKPYSIIRDDIYRSKEAIDYIPQNNDGKFWGNITIRESLANSRNIPAIRVLEKLGIATFYNSLLKAGLNHMDRGHKFYGPGIILGSGGISLLDLARLYSSFLNQGSIPKIFLGNIKGIKKFYGKEDENFFSSDSSYKITHILSDTGFRKRGYGQRNLLEFPFEVAIKTGTSDRYRDSWTVGYLGRFVIGVWVGNFSGEPMDGVSGGLGAARIFHQIVRLLIKSKKFQFKYPKGYTEVLHCRLTGLIATKNCPGYLELYSPSDIKPDTCPLIHKNLFSEKDFRVLRPLNGEIFYNNPTLPISIQEIPLEVNCKTSQNIRLKIDNMKKINISCNKEMSLKLDTGIHSFEFFRNSKLAKKIIFEIKN